MICEIEGRVLGGMQFEVLVDAALVVPGATVEGMFGVLVDAVRV